MAMYTQVKSTAGYVGLNALEYLMQTVSSFHNSQNRRLSGLTDLVVFQRRLIRVGTRTFRHRLPWQRQWYALLPGSYRWYRRTFCR